MNSALYSKQIASRFEKFKIVRRVLALLYLLIYLIYLGWRLTIFAPHSFLLSFFYFIAECFGFILSLTIILNSWKYKHRDSKKSTAGLSVDVFVLTYQEPIEIIKKTIQAAKNIDYPHQVWVLDDGRREEVRALAKSIGVNYNSRSFNTNAKAGNLNFGLSLSTAEFIMVFDADHIALPHALDITLGFFDDYNVGMVQTPQDYYNTDAFQYINFNNNIWHDQSFFYNISQPCQDSYNSSSCVGTGVVYRRSVIDEIGGFPTLTVTEDIHTSLKIHKAGYQTAYLNESIAYGIAAADLTEYYKTRHRWAHGNLQALKHEKILTCKGLSLMQRISYLSLGLIYLEGWQKLLLFLVPVVTLIFGIPPFEISIFNIAIVLLFPLFSYIMLQEIGCGFSNFWANELFAIIRWPIHIISIVALFGKKIKWVSSSKKIRSEVNWFFMIPQLTILLISIVSIIIAIIKLKNNYLPGPIFIFFKNYINSLISFSSHNTSVFSGPFKNNPINTSIYNVISDGYSIDLVTIAGCWVLYTIIKILFFLGKVFKNKNTRNFFQFKIPFPVLLEDGNQGRTIKISEEIIKFDVFVKDIHKYKIGNNNKLEISLNTTSVLLNIEIKKIVFEYKSSTATIEAKIIWDDELAKQDLANCLYSVNWHRVLFNNNINYFATPISFIIKLISFKYKLPVKTTEWKSVLYKTVFNGLNITNCAFLSKYNKTNDLAILVIFKQIQSNEFFISDIPSLVLPQSEIHLKIIKEIPLELPDRKCLDKSIMRHYLVKVM